MKVPTLAKMGTKKKKDLLLLPIKFKPSMLRVDPKVNFINKNIVLFILSPRLGRQTLACSEPSNTRTSRLTVGQINYVEAIHGNNKEESSNIILSIPFPNVPRYYVVAIKGKLKLIWFKDGFKAVFKDGFKAVLTFLRLMSFQ
jgi:hypothetical protein